MIIRRYFILSLSALMLAGCAGDEVVNNSSSTDERLPLRLEATLSGNRPVTRAVGSEFETGDVLYSYVQHVYNDGENYTQVTGIEASLVEFKNPTVDEVDGNTYNLTPGTALYWDDFSKSSDDGASDLRKDNHGLRSYYGYCFNGIEKNSVALTESTGVLTWSVSTNQSAGGIKTSDLLWSNTQAPVEYKHAVLERGKLTVPYTHAMSKFTVVVVAGDGFKAEDLDGATITLHDMNIIGSFTAPSAEVSATETKNVTMYGKKRADDANQRIFEAIVVPTTSLAENKHLATITMAGNTYKVNISAGMLTSWADGIKNEASKSGVNYQLTVELKKQTINVSATLADWIPVTATGEGEIQFSADIKDKGNNDTNLKKNDSFSLWRAKKVGDTTPAEADFGTKATIYSYDGESFSVSSTSDPIYWPNKDDSYFFRALAYQTSEHTLLEVTSTEAKQGTDLLWATTPLHETYEAGAAIAPRTGTVPLSFEHAMSKVIITLATKADNEDPAYVNLSKATIKLTNLSTSGIIALIDGEINAADAVASAFDDGKSGDIKMMIPQKLDNAKLVINLHDGATDATSTTYSLSLKDCIDDKSKVKIGEWLRGNQYSYTITITKEDVKFRAMVQDWTENKGSGNATLDWD